MTWGSLGTRVLTHPHRNCPRHAACPLAFCAAVARCAAWDECCRPWGGARRTGDGGVLAAAGGTTWVCLIYQTSNFPGEMMKLYQTILQVLGYPIFRRTHMTYDI